MMPDERKAHLESVQTPDQRWAKSVKAWKVAMVQLHLANLALASRDAGGNGNIDSIGKQTIEEFLNNMIPNGVGLSPTKVIVPE